MTADAATQSSAPDWSWYFLGTGIGNGQLLASPNGNALELIVPCGASGFTFGSRYWLVMRHDALANDYQQRFVSPLYPESNPIVKMLVGDVLTDPGNPGAEIVVIMRNGDTEIWNQAGRRQAAAFAGSLTNTKSACLGDVDADGDLDIVLVAPTGLAAFDHTGQLLFQRTDLRGTDVVAGQFDADPPIELVTTDGNIFDCGAQAIQQQWLNGYPGDLDAADIDNDGMLELIVADPIGLVWAHDIDTLIPKFSKPVASASVVTIGNIDGDANLEIGVGTPNSGPVIAFDSVTLAQDFSVLNTDSGVNSLAFGDFDNDGQVEVAWGAGFFSTGPDKLHIAGIPNQAIEWSSADVGGPMIGPVFGDVDNDGNDEMIVIANRGVFSNARLLFFDPTTLRQKFQSDQLSGPFVASATGLSLADVDGDGDQEIIVCNGDCRVYDYSGGQLTTLWQVQGGYFPNPTYQQARVADLDGDGTLEIVACGIYAHIFSYGSTTERYRSFYLGGLVRQMEVAQIDADPGLEILALSDDGNVYVFDGATRAPQIIVQDQGVDRSAFALIPTNIPGYGLPYPSLVVGDESGRITFLINIGTDFASIGPFPTGSGAIDGLRWIGNTSMFAYGQGGQLHVQDVLNPLWTSRNLGPGFGAGMHADLATRTLTAVGSLGVAHFQF